MNVFSRAIYSFFQSHRTIITTCTSRVHFLFCFCSTYQTMEMVCNIEWMRLTQVLGTKQRILVDKLTCWLTRLTERHLFQSPAERLDTRTTAHHCFTDKQKHQEHGREFIALLNINISVLKRRRSKTWTSEERVWIWVHSGVVHSHTAEAAFKLLKWTHFILHNTRSYERRDKICKCWNVECFEIAFLEVMIVAVIRYASISWQKKGKICF